ncbi:NUDIX domain-containing protein [Herbihabitans rhizosphaerae]|uniref:NUDIX domain-containing protein n=1 Tax=Herbihabitans rhizosphaerae TaxID=1872711 RepID=A0A4V2ETJ4_9PSEU|nr:CoA pyrophosphatase [Herbihabitans rhizosphaerae]RZS41283.1 NUDIX domain-containing protein [Herbihabitans rhizosphaerae]
MIGPLVEVDDVPEWMRPLVAATADLDSEVFRRLSPPDGEDTRAAAVLILFGSELPHGPDVLLQLRADGSSAHSGQVAFPGGAAEDYDETPVATALREATEETGLDPAGVRPVAVLPELFITPSRFLVTPVLAHWDKPSEVSAVDPAETQAVARVPIAELADPANRFMVRRSVYMTPAFGVRGTAAEPMLVWGFTAAIMTVLLAIGEWEKPWDHTDIRDLDVALRSAGQLGSGGRR